MKRVLIESPLKGDYALNKDYAKRCARDCLSRGESPYASHLFFDQEGLLDDTDTAERELGIEAGLAWGDAAELVAVYTDLGVSDGMRFGIDRHEKNGTPIEYRTLPTKG
ncbi:MAG: DUF7768 domain-containing protein [Planctomycetota bacterium]